MATPARKSAIRGLATVALLKVNFDSGRDHIGMFEPFVVDAVVHRKAEDFATEELRDEIAARHDLALPVHTLSILLTRAARRGYVRREGGRYFRQATHPPVEDLRASRLRVEERQRKLAAALREVAAGHGLEVATDEDALGLILSFLERYHVSLALDGASIEPDVREPSPAETPQLVITARFLRDTIAEGAELAAVVQETLEGYILQNTLLLREIPTATRRFRNLEVYCDSGLLFGALGLTGLASERAIRELFRLLRETGAGLSALATTLREMRRILSLYESRIGTSEGRLSLRPTDLTRHFLTNHYSPSEIRMESATLEPNLAGLGVSIRRVPKHVPEWTWDEGTLAKVLADPDRPSGETDDRVLHDVECVAAVLTVRRGITTESLDDARAVFASSSGRTVRNSTDWYRKEGGVGTPPMVHYLVLSNLAWLKKPSAATALKLIELVALCAAALRPTREAWQAFLRHLRNLETAGRLTSDEVTALIVNGLTEGILVDAGIDEMSDASTLAEVVERVKAAQHEASEVRVRDAEKQAEASRTEALTLRRKVDARAESIGRGVSWVLAGLMSASFVFGTAFGLVTVIRGGVPSLLMFALAFVPLAVAGLLGVLNGFTVSRWRAQVEARVANLVRVWMLGST